MIIASWDCAMRSIACIIIEIDENLLNSSQSGSNPINLLLQFTNKLKSSIKILHIFSADVFKNKKNLKEIEWGDKVIEMRNYITMVSQHIPAHAIILIEKQPVKIIMGNYTKVNVGNLSVEHFLFYHFCTTYKTYLQSPKMKTKINICGANSPVFMHTHTARQAYLMRKQWSVNNFKALLRIFSTGITFTEVMVLHAEFIDDVADACMQALYFAQKKK